MPLSPNETSALINTKTVFSGRNMTCSHLFSYESWWPVLPSLLFLEYLFVTDYTVLVLFSMQALKSLSKKVLVCTESFFLDSHWNRVKAVSLLQLLTPLSFALKGVGSLA